MNCTSCNMPHAGHELVDSKCVRCHAKDSAWGNALWDWIKDKLPDASVSMEIDTEDLMELAAKHGKARKVIFDPEVHGMIDAEPGHEIWWWGN